MGYYGDRVGSVQGALNGLAITQPNTKPTVPGFGDTISRMGRLGNNIEGSLDNLFGLSQRTTERARSGFDAFRNNMRGLRPHLREIGQNSMDAARGWSGVEQQAAQDAIEAGSFDRIQARRDAMRSDVLGGIQDMMRIQQQQQAAQGIMGGAQPQDDLMAKYGHQAGAAMNQAGEQERMYGEQMRAALAPLAQQMRQGAMQAAQVEAQSYITEAQSYADEARIAMQGLQPYMQSVGQLANVYGSMINGAAQNAQAEAMAANQRLNAAHFQNQMWGQMGQGLDDIWEDVNAPPITTGPVQTNQRQPQPQPGGRVTSAMGPRLWDMPRATFGF